MKWTRTEQIEYDPDDLPNEVMQVLITHTMHELHVWIDSTGQIRCGHEWSTDENDCYSGTLSELVEDFISMLDHSPQGNEWGQRLLSELEKAGNILRNKLARINEE